ncbi:MAG: hypothetical protein H5T86_04515 [Armatimonadetes bacterium]|nr:hypothetical protein [Armatimonadota bacterium]
MWDTTASVCASVMVTLVLQLGILVVARGDEEPLCASKPLEDNRTPGEPLDLTGRRMVLASWHHV